MPATWDLDRLGPYELGKVLGRGSMGVVYVARRAGTEERFALKVMRGGDDDPVSVARFEREAEVAARIAHPNVVRVVDRGVASGSLYYVMELCPGPTLQERLRGGRLAPWEAARLVRDLASGIAAAHAAGAIHRDLKPANVILAEPDGRPRVTDFGLARDAWSSANLTRSGDTIGTPYYMAPEQVRAHRDLDARVDVYALGVILFECLAGARPFEAKAAPELGKLILAGTSRSLRELAPDVPVTLEAIARKAFALERSDRYATPVELRADLDRFLRGARPLALDARDGPPPRRLRAVAWGAAALVFASGLAVHFVRRTGPALVMASAAKLGDDRVKPVATPLLLAAESAAREKRPDAFEAWQRARAAASGDAAAELAYAAFLVRRNHAREAVSVLRPLSLRPLDAADLAHVHGLLGEALLREQPADLEAARDELAKVAAGDEPAARLARARLALLDGARDEARRLAETAGDLPGAHALVAHVLAAEWEPARALAHYRREALDAGEMARADALAADALRHADRAVALAPDDVDAITARSEVRANLHVNRWYAHATIERNDAYRRFTTARRRDLDDAIALAAGEAPARALVLRGRDRYFFAEPSAARDDLEAALALAPRDVEALVVRACIALHAHEAPIVWLRRALEVDERATFAVARHFQVFHLPVVELVFRADAERRNERLDAVKRARATQLDERLARAPADVRGALRDAAMRAQRGAKVTELLAALEPAARRAPDSPAVYVERGRALLGRGRLDEALGALDTARALGAEPGWCDGLRAEAQRRGDRHATSDRAKAERAVQAAPEDPEARIAFAAALLEGDDPEPDAAAAQALAALDLEDDADIEAIHIFVLGDALAPLLLPHPQDEQVALARQALERGAKRIEALARGPRWHVRAALLLMAAPSDAARALGRAELARARAIDAAETEKLLAGRRP